MRKLWTDFQALPVAARYAILLAVGIAVGLVVAWITAILV